MGWAARVAAQKRAIEDSKTIRRRWERLRLEIERIADGFEDLHRSRDVSERERELVDRLRWALRD